MGQFFAGFYKQSEQLPISSSIPSACLSQTQPCSDKLRKYRPTEVDILTETSNAWRRNAINPEDLPVAKPYKEKLLGSNHNVRVFRHANTKQQFQGSGFKRHPIRIRKFNKATRTPDTIAYRTMIKLYEIKRTKRKRHPNTICRRKPNRKQIQTDVLEILDDMSSVVSLVHTAQNLQKRISTMSLPGRTTPPLHDIVGLSKELQYRLAYCAPQLIINEDKCGRFSVKKCYRRKSLKLLNT